MAEATSAAGREQELAAKLRDQLSAASSDAARQVCCCPVCCMGAWESSLAPATSVAVRLATLLVPRWASCDDMYASQKAHRRHPQLHL